MTTDRYAQIPVIIADNEATSEAADITGYKVIGVAAPIMTWVAADLTVEVDFDGSGTYYPIEFPKNSGDETAVDFFRIVGVATGAAVRSYLIGSIANRLVGVSARIRSVNAGSEADVNQTNGPLTFKLLLEALP